MKRTSDFANLVLSVLVALTMVLAAVQPAMAQTANRQASNSSATLGWKNVTASVGMPITISESLVAGKAGFVAQLTGTWPVYADLVLDESRGWIYGSDSAGAKIDVIRISNLTLVKSISLPGTAPKGMALSPEGSELAVANYGIGGMFDTAIGSIIFLNPDSNAIISSVIPNIGPYSSNRPWDVVYGNQTRQRLYSIGNPNSAGMDYIHVIDSTTHTEVGHSVYPNTVSMCPSMAISPDKNSLYVSQSCESSAELTKYDITTDVPTPVASAPFGSTLTGKNIVLSADGSKIFSDSGEVWTAELKGRIGSTGQAGNIALLPARDAIAVAVDNATGSDAVSFYSTDDYYGIKTYSLPTQGTLGPLVVSSDGSRLFVNSSGGMFAIDLSSGLPGTTIPLPSGSLPYFDLVADDVRGVLYGSDSSGHKIDVISMTTLQVVNSYRLVNGADPKGIALSPDGSELAVAEGGASSIAFLDLQTGQTSASLVLNVDSLNLPWDLVYGRPGRLYSVGNPGSSGYDYIHVVDTSTHSEISRSSFYVRMRPSLQISADKTTLYYLVSSITTPTLYSVDVTSDTLPSPVSSPPADWLHAVNFVLLDNENKIFTDSGQVWSLDLRGQIGSTGQKGNIALLPTHNAIAVAVNNSGTDAVSFYDTEDYYGIKTYSLPDLGTMGPMVARSDGSKLFVSSSSGITAIDLSLGLPGMPIPLPSGSLPYYDLVADEARGVLYGSDSSGHKIDVISMATLQVVNQYRLVNGAAPAAIALSPDSSELAVAESGASSIVFLNPENGQMVASLMPNIDSKNIPWGLVYGRSDRLYSVGNPSSMGMDYVHVIDVVTHTEVGISLYPNVIRMCPALAISSDKNNLFIYESCQSPKALSNFDVTTDTPTDVTSKLQVFLSGTNIILSTDDSKIFTNSGQVWDSSLSGQIGSTGQGGSIALLPAYNAFVVAVDNAGNDAISFYDEDTYYGIKSYTLPALGMLGPIVSLKDGSRLFISSSSGVASVDLSTGLPGTPIPLPTGSQLYFDLEIDEARGVIYGSDPEGQKIDVISMATLQVVKQFRLVNGAYPVGIDLSSDGSELAVAEYGASSIVFLNPDTGQTIASLIPQAVHLNLPWDVLYGRSGRLYTTGTPASYGLDYVHVIDTSTHTEVGHTGFNGYIRDHPTLAITSDYNTLYVDESYPSQHMIHEYDVSTDSPGDPVKNLSLGVTLQNATILLLSDQSKLLTSAGDIVDADLLQRIGTFSPSGRLAEIPSHNAFLSTSGNQITYFDSSNYQQIGFTILNGVTSIGSVVVNSDESALFVTTDAGLKLVDLAVFPPPPPLPPASFDKTAPANGATNQSVKPTFSWQASSDVSYYEYCYDTTNDNACSSWVNNGLSTSVTLRTSLITNKTYYWQVRAVSPAGTTYANGSGTAYWSFKTGLPPNAFGKAIPANVSTKVLPDPTLIWNASTNAASYEYCVDTIGNTVCDTSWIGLTGTSVTLHGLSDNTTYYWQVRALGAGAMIYADSGVWWRFSVSVPPTASAGMYDDNANVWSYSGSWSSQSASSAYGGSYKRTTATDASTTVYFNGVQVMLYYTKNSSMGNLDVYVDDALVTTLNQKSSTAKYKQTWLSPVYADGTHAITFVRNSNMVNVDALQVIPAPDAIPPVGITDLAATTGVAYGQVNLEWTAVGDDANAGTATSYQVRYATTVIDTDAAWDAATPVASGLPAPAAAGTTQSMTVSGLAPSQTYYFAVRAVDDGGNSGPLSNSPSAETLTPIPTLPGTYDDNADAWFYTGTWASQLAKSAYGGSYSYTATVGGSATVYFGGGQVMLYYTKNSGMGNLSVYVDGTLVTTIKEKSSLAAYKKTWLSPVYADGIHSVTFVCSSGKVNVDAIQVVPPPDLTPPAPITDLSAASGASNGQVDLHWTAVGDDDNVGTAASYQIRYASTVIDTDAKWAAATPVIVGLQTPAVSGTAQDMTVSGLAPSLTYYFAVRAVDESGNAGALSNSPPAVALAPAPVSAGTYDNLDANWIFNGTWTAATVSGASGGDVAASSTVGSSAALVFDGSGFTLRYYTKNINGSLAVYVDGVLKTILKQKSNTTKIAWRTYVVSGLTPGVHVIQLVDVSGKVNFDTLVIAP